MIKALKCIRIPLNIISIIDNIFSQRRNKIIMNGHISAEYKIEDGLDQGEVWSPLLWCIFFDPLLLELKSRQEGYTIQLYDNQRQQHSHSENHSFKINHAAYMD